MAGFYRHRLRQGIAEAPVRPHLRGWYCRHGIPVKRRYPTNRSNGGNEKMDWRGEFRDGLANLVDEAVVSGAKQAEVFQAAMEEIERLRIAN